MTCSKRVYFASVWEGSDPSTNVVLLEDVAAILGVGIAATCMGISYYTGRIRFQLSSA